MDYAQALAFLKSQQSKEMRSPECIQKLREAMAIVSGRFAVDLPSSPENEPD